MSLREKYKFLVQHVPSSTASLFSQCTTKLDNDRKEIILCHRIIALSDILNNTNKENRNKYNLSKSIVKQREFVLKPEFYEAPFSITPFLCQQATSLLNYAHSHTNDLADQLINIKGTKQFSFLALSTIPALFGYYSSNEHINLAMSFFVKVVQSADTMTATSLLSPFFSAPCLFRYFEASLVPFVDAFIRDTRPMDDVLINKYARDLELNFKSNASLIPHTHVVLLRMMYVKWGDKSTCNFFFNNLLNRETLLWYQTVKNDQASINNIKKILDLLPQSEILQVITKSDSSIEVPFQYTVFEDPFLYFLMTISDLRELYKLFKAKISQPSMNIIITEKVNKNGVFWLKTYPPHQIETFFINKPFIFNKFKVDVKENEDYERQWRNLENFAANNECYPMDIIDSKDNRLNCNIQFTEAFKNYALEKSVKELSETSEIFEQFLIYRVYVKDTEEWQQISFRHEQTILSPIIKKIVIETEKESKSYIDVYEKISYILSSNENKRYNYLFIVQRFLKKLLKGYEKEFAFIKQKMGEFFKKKSANLDTLNSTNYLSRSSMFWDTVEMLRIIGSDDLPFQYNTLMRSLEKLNSITNDEEMFQELLELAISLADCSDIFFVYMVINLFAMNIETFRQISTEEQQHLWVLFQRKMLKLVMSDDEISERYFKLIGAFSQ